ncbi:MAG: hypothetical protein JSW32_04660 [Deltaproteobacteria bacterium]|nr:MAG: hypothetical protein JSW32_04660 [Deltaproteobacteria bacterium]
MPYQILSVKLILWVGVITVLVIGGFAYVNLITQRTYLLKGVILEAIKAEELHLSPQVMKEEDLLPSSDEKTIRAVEKKHILNILNENNWNIQKSAEILGIDRVTLYNKIKKYDLTKG